MIDDDASVRRGLTRLLRAMRWEVSAFGSAEEFLNSLPRGSVDLALVDIHLPGMTGIDLLIRLTQEGTSLQVVLMTAHGEAETQEMLIPVSATPCLRKPFTKEQLLGAIL